jgi:hypothetical protein
MDVNESINRVKELMGIISEKNISIEIKRRLPQIKLLLEVILNNSYPCDFGNSDLFRHSILYDLEVSMDLIDISNLGGITTEDIYDFVDLYMKDDIIRYYWYSQEDC